MAGVPSALKSVHEAVLLRKEPSESWLSRQVQSSLPLTKVLVQESRFQIGDDATPTTCGVPDTVGRTILLIAHAAEVLDKRTKEDKIMSDIAAPACTRRNNKAAMNT